MFTFSQIHEIPHIKFKILTIKIRKDENTKVISVNNTEYKLSMMANNTTLTFKRFIFIRHGINILSNLYSVPA